MYFSVLSVTISQKNITIHSMLVTFLYFTFLARMAVEDRIAIWLTANPPDSLISLSYQITYFLNI